MTATLLLIAQLWAAEPPNLLRFFPAEVLSNEIIEFKTVAGHHFSMEAPQSCGSGAMIDKNPRILKCQFAAAGVTKAALNVCDDKKTFCRPIPLNINVREGQGSPAQSLLKNQTLNHELKRKLVPGFVMGEPKDVTRKAAAEQGNVFVMISTDWCPPCNEAKEYLLNTTGFQVAARDWFKVYVDGDSMGAAAWENQIPYKYYPSFVLLNSRMEELGRYTGELRLAEFSKWAADTNGLDPIPRLEARVRARLDGKWLQRAKDYWNGVSVETSKAEAARLLRYAMDLEQDELAERLIASGEFPNLQVPILRFQLAKLEKMDPPPAEARLNIYNRLLTATLNGDHWGEILGGLCEADAEACKPWLDKVSGRFDWIEKRADLLEPERESQLGDEYYYVSGIYSGLKDDVNSKKFARRCAGHFSALREKSILKISRAGHQGMVACLEMAGDFKAEEKALLELISAYPNEQTFLARMARMARKQKNPKKALEWLEKAEGLAYGYNWFTLQFLKADIYLELNDKNSAKKVVDSTLNQLTLDGLTESRNQRLVTRLRTLQAKVESAPN